MPSRASVQTKSTLDLTIRITEKAVGVLPEEHHFQDAVSDAYRNLGWLFQAQGDYLRAVDAYSNSIEIDQDNFDAYFNRGLVYHKLQAFEDAERDYTNAIALDSGHSDAYVNRGGTRAALENYYGAKDDLLVATQLAPLDPAGYINLGSARVALGEYAVADSDFRRAMKIGRTLHLPSVFGTGARQCGFRKLLSSHHPSYQTR